MFDGDSEAEEVVNQDRKSHPGCGYSTNIESTCGTNDEGKFVCRTMKVIQRNCPGKAPVSVYDKTTKGAGSNISIFGDLFSGLLKKGKELDVRIEEKASKGELEHDIREAQKSLEEMMGGGQRDLKGLFDELMKEAHRGGKQPSQQHSQPSLPRDRDHHRPLRGAQQQPPQLPYAQEYDKLVEEAMDGFYDDKQSASVAKRKGTRSGNVEKI